MQTEDLEPLDLAACFGSDAVSRTISIGTASLFAPKRLKLGPSHVAVICVQNGSALWVESTTLCEHPCVIRRECVGGAQAHLPEHRIQDYVNAGGRVDLYRLTPIDRLSHAESGLLTRILITHFIRRDVSYDTGGALLSGTRLFKHTRLFPRADLNQLFCSELAAKVLMRLGRLNRDNPTKFNPATLVRRLVRDGTVQLHRTYDSN